LSSATFFVYYTQIKRKPPGLPDHNYKAKNTTMKTTTLLIVGLLVSLSPLSFSSTPSGRSDDRQEDRGERQGDLEGNRDERQERR
jgi:hypothetical protein